MADEKLPSNIGIEKAIEVAGSQAKLAKLLNVTQPAISHFLHCKCPVERAVQVERLTGVPRGLIRPDIYDN